MDCIIIDDHELSRQIMEQFIKKTDLLSLADSFADPVSALSFLSTNKVDLIFLDVQMPEMNGLEFMKAMAQQLPQVIFTTHHKEFAFDAFEYNATDYLVKPIEYPRFFKAITKAKSLFEKQIIHSVDKDTVFLKKNGSVVRINKSEVLWIEAMDDYVVLNTSKEKFIIHSTMNVIERKFPSQEYMRVHRSYIVRIDKIDSIEDNAIALQQKLIPIGRSYKDAVVKRLNIL